MALRFDGVLFDLGGTLFSHLASQVTDANLTQALGALGGQDIDVAAALATYRGCRSASEKAYLGSAFYLHKQIVLDAFASMLEVLGLPQSDSAAQDFYARQRESVVSQLALRDESLAVLDALREQDCYLGIVSNIDNDYFLPLLERTGLGSYMSHSLSSETAGSCKPDTAIFQQAISASELTPDRLLYVGDSPHHDVVGAHAAGMAVAWLASAAPDGADRELGANANYRIDSLTDLVGIVSDTCG